MFTNSYNYSNDNQYGNNNYSDKNKEKKNNEKILRHIYYEIDSTYRNRNLYPQQGFFGVRVGNMNRFLSGINATDPIIDSYGIVTFVGDSVTTAGTFTGGTPLNPILDNTASSIDGFYIGAFLTNTTTSQSEIITDYEGYTRRVTLSSPFGIPFSVTDSYSITDISDNQNIFLQDGPLILNSFSGLYLYDQNIDESRLISSYNAEIKLITLTTAFSGAWNINNTYKIIKSLPTSVGLLPGAVLATSCQLAATEPIITGYYKGYYIYFTSGPLVGVLPLLITAYDGPTQTVTFTPSVTPTGFFPITYEILAFSRNNETPLNSNSQLDPYSFYEIKLLDLVVPNCPLIVNMFDANNTTSGCITDFPYVYVGIDNQGNSRHNSVINSNNPNSPNAVFRCIIDDISQFADSSFVKLKCYMKHILRINLNEDLIFRVLLPSGMVFQTLEKDTTSPLPPNPQLQISAAFQIKEYLTKDEAGQKKTK